MLHWDSSDALAQIKVPVLVMSGEQDTTTLPVASDVMSERIPDDARLSVSTAAHLGPIERHEQYNDAVETFANARLRPQEQARNDARPAGRPPY
jgi:pimeloyl-ACP methyl ester carboxylesterase